MHWEAKPNSLSPACMEVLRQLRAQQPSEFLRARLAKAQAVPPAERSLEVAAFISCCELQREAAELVVSGTFIDRALAPILLGAVKLARAHYLSPTLRRAHRLEYHPTIGGTNGMALTPLLLLLGHGFGEPGRPTLERDIIAGLESNDSLDLAVCFAAALPYLMLSPELISAAAAYLSRLAQPPLRQELGRQLVQLQNGAPDPFPFDFMLASMVDYLAMNAFVDLHWGRFAGAGVPGEGHSLAIRYAFGS